MARRPQFRDEDLLQAARDVFLARGGNATTAEVARRAGVSEGTLFHHFKTKAALFRAAINRKDDEPASLSGLVGRAGNGEVGSNLMEFCTALLEWLRVRAPLMFLAWANAGPEERRKLICDADPLNARLMRILAGYLEAEIRLGRLRAFDAEIAARAMVGGVFDYVRSELLGGSGGLPLPSAMYLRGLVDIFLNGIHPAVAVPPRRKRRTTRH